VLYLSRSGCQCRTLPRGLPKWRTGNLSKHIGSYYPPIGLSNELLFDEPNYERWPDLSYDNVRSKPEKHHG
jgi:hypothetical protein